MIASRMASGMSGIAAPRRTFSPWVVSPLLSVIVCTVSSVCLWCATRLDSHAHLCSIFQTYVGPTRSLPGGVCVCVCLLGFCAYCAWMRACVCVRDDVATPCPVQTRRRLCRKPHRQAWLTTGARCAWHPAEGEGRNTAGPGRLKHLSHGAKGPSGGATNSRTGPVRNDNEDRDCRTRDCT